ncbi:MAG: phage portal protein family protein [Thermoanaerobaculia bacterium]
MQNNPILYGPYSEILTLPSKLDTDTQADIGRVAHGDRWASREIRDITPEALARVLRNSADLAEMFALGDRIYLDAHFLSVATDRVSTVAGAEWDVLPYTDAPRASAKDDDRKVATSVAEKLYGIPSLETYFEHLAWGDGLYPLSAAETRFNPSTFLPEGFNTPDGVRFRYVGSELRLLTEAEPLKGESLKPGLWTVHSISPTNSRKTRLFKALAFYYMVSRFATIDWLAFAEKYGKPIPVAYFTDPNDKPSLIEAVMRIGVDFAGVLPPSAKRDLEQALNASKDIYEGLARFAHEQATKAVCGHTLIVDAQSGTGTLAGEGAQRTNLKVARAVSKRVAASIRQGLIRTIVALHHGPRYLSRLPVLQFKVDPPEDAKQRASTYVEWNRVIEAAGMMIYPEHVKEVSGIPSFVPRAVAPGAVPRNDKTSANDSDDSTERTNAAPAIAPIPASNVAQVRETLKDVSARSIAPKAAVRLIRDAGYEIDEAEEMVREQLTGAATMADRRTSDAAPTPTASQKWQFASQRESVAPVIRTLTDAVIAGTFIQQHASRKQTEQMLAIIDDANARNLTPEAMRDLIIEQYESFDHSRAAEALAEGMVVAEAVAYGDEAERAGESRAA